MGFFDSIGSGISGLFNNQDPMRAAQVRGGMLGAAQALLQPYGNIGNAAVGAGMGAQQAKSQYADDEFRMMRAQQLKDQMAQAKAQREALNNLFRTPTPSPTGSAPPQSPGMLSPGNIDLHSRPIVPNGNGYSTVRSKSFNFDGKEVLLPTVSDDGRLISDQEAIDQFKKTGKSLGVFATPQDATRYAESLHNDQAAEYGARAGQPQQGGMRLPAGFNSPEEFQAYAQLDPEGAIKRLYPEQQKPLVGKPGDIFLDPTDYHQLGAIPDRPKPPPTTGGMYWDEGSQSFKAIPGYEDQARRVAAAGRAPANPDGGWRDLTRDEKIARGLPADAAYQIGLSGASKGRVDRIGGNNSVRPIPAQALAGIQGNRLALSKIDRAIAAIRENPEALGLRHAFLPDAATQRMDGKGNKGGINVRALVADIGSLKIHDRSGAAVTAAETPRLKPFIPSVSDTPEAAIAKLEQLKADPTANLDEAEAFYSPESGYMSIPSNDAPTAPPPPAKPSMLPRPKTPADAMKLKPGTKFIDGNGVERVR